MNIVLTTIILFVVFGVLLFMGVPISVSIIVSSIVTAMSTLSWDQITFITMQKMNSGIESFSLLAVSQRGLSILHSFSWENFRETWHRPIFLETCSLERSPVLP